MTIYYNKSYVNVVSSLPVSEYLIVLWICSMDMLDGGMIHVSARWSRAAVESITLLEMACNLKVGNSLFLEFYL